LGSEQVRRRVDGQVAFADVVGKGRVAMAAFGAFGKAGSAA